MDRLSDNQDSERGRKSVGVVKKKITCSSSSMRHKYSQGFPVPITNQAVHRKDMEAHNKNFLAGIYCSVPESDQISPSNSSTTPETSYSSSVRYDMTRT